MANGIEDVLLGKLIFSSNSIRRSDAKMRDLFEKMSSDDMPLSSILDYYTNANPILKKVVSAIKSYDRSVKDLERLTATNINPYAVSQLKSLELKKAGRLGPGSSQHGITLAHSKALETIANRGAEFKERLSAFRNATLGSGFQRYVEAESKSNAEIDERDANDAEFNRKLDAAKVMGIKEEQEKRRAGFDRGHKAQAQARLRRMHAYKNFEYDMMDEFDQKMHDLTERYGGDAGKADASLRNMLKKELGPFFKNSRMSTNDLHGLSKNMRMAKGIPLLGRFISNPYAAGLLAAGAIIGEVSSDVKKTSQSNFVSAKQQNKGRIWGKPSKRFTRAAEAAGLSGIEIDNLWGELFYKFGNPEAIENFSSIRPGPQRGFASQSLGLNDDVFFIADYLAGDRTTRSGLRDSVTAKSMVDYIKKYGRSGKDFSTRWLARVWNNPLWLLGLGAVDEASALSAEPGSETWKNMEKAVKDIQSVVYDTEETARAYDTYQQSRADNPSYYDYVTNNNGGSPVSIHIDTAEFNGIENLDGLKNEVSAEANTVKERHATAEAYDPKMR